MKYRDVTVFLDEVQERSPGLNECFCLFKKHPKVRAPVTSATLDPDRLQEHLLAGVLDLTDHL